MSDNQQTTGGASGGNGGAGAGNAGGDSPQNNANNSNGQPKVVPWEVHERMQTDLVKAKDKNRELEARIGEIESNSLKEKNDYKSLYERAETDKSELKKQLEDQSRWIVSTQRFNAVKAEAVAAGLRKEAFDDLEKADLKDIKVEVTSSGRYIVSGAREKVESLKTEKPHWFTTQAPPPVNVGGTSSGDAKPGQRLTAQDVSNASMDMKRGKITRRQYHEIYNRYLVENKNSSVIPMGDPAGKSSTQK